MPAPLGGEIGVLNLAAGDLFGQTALTRTGTPWALTALTEVTVLVVPYDVLTDLVRRDNRLARELSVEIDQRKEAVEAARAQTDGQDPRPLTSGAAARA